MIMSNSIDHISNIVELIIPWPWINITKLIIEMGDKNIDKMMMIRRSNDWPVGAWVNTHFHKFLL